MTYEIKHDFLKCALCGKEGKDHTFAEWIQHNRIHCDAPCTRAEAAEKERDEARQSAIDSHADAVKAVTGQLREIRKTEATEQQVKSLEEYMLKGVAFRDELQSRIAELERERDQWIKYHDSVAAECKRWRKDAQELFGKLAALSPKEGK